MDMSNMTKKDLMKLTIDKKNGELSNRTKSKNIIKINKKENLELNSFHFISNIEESFILSAIYLHSTELLNETLKIFLYSEDASYNVELWKEDMVNIKDYCFVQDLPFAKGDEIKIEVTNLNSKTMIYVTIVIEVV